MSFVQLFSPHLPYLRRYARALTGSQQSGDRYIRAALEALAQDPSTIGDHPESNPRQTFYKFFHTIWSSTGAQLDKPMSDSPDEKLSILTPRSRQAFLLTALEGFSKADTAKILGTDEKEVDRLVASAQEDIEAELRTKILIVEDEPVIAADLEALVEELGHDVTGNATTYDEAVTLAKQDPPGLVLCDIQLADNSSGIDAARDIIKTADVPVIFITAFPERLLTGEKPEPTYLISKPFQDNTVKAAIGQALFFHPRKVSN